MSTPVKFPNLCTGNYRSYKQLKMGTFEGVFVVRLQLKWHNFGQWKSFRGLVNIPRMCLSSVSFGSRHTVWALNPRKTPNFGEISNLQNY